MRNIVSFSFLVSLATMPTFPTAFRSAKAIPSASSHTLTLTAGNELKFLTANGAWKMHSIISDKRCDTNGDGILTTNVGSELPPCALDDIMYIKPNDKVVFERFKRCDPSEGDVEEFNWKLTGDNKFIIYKGSIVAEMTFKYVTREELSLVIPSEAHGVMYYFTVTYRHP